MYSRREIQMHRDLRYLNPKKKRKDPPPLSEEEMKELARKYGKKERKRK